jgi:hypothetical protein
LSVIQANGKANGKAINVGGKTKKKFAQLPGEAFGIVSPSGEGGSGVNNSKKNHSTTYSRRHNAFSPGEALEKGNKGRKSGKEKKQAHLTVFGSVDMLSFVKSAWCFLFVFDMAFAQR